jgi:hypothetical protein
MLAIVMPPIVGGSSAKVYAIDIILRRQSMATRTHIKVRALNKKTGRFLQESSAKERMKMRQHLVNILISI